MATKKFKCTVCGYVHEGDSAPDKCPACQQPGSVFVEITETPATDATPEQTTATTAPKKKGLNTNGNGYIIMYSCLMVVIVAFLLAYVSSALKPQQDINVALDKKTQILAALNIHDISGQAAEAKYAEVVTADPVLDATGQQTAATGGFALNSGDYKAGHYAIYLCNVAGQKKYVVPVYGMGLWGPIWGYIAVDADGKTIYGAYFNHEGETAGLGAEIKDSREWQSRFAGKTIYAADGTPAIAVKKASEVKNPQSEVDAVTGATLTSNGVSDMLRDGFAKYKAYFDKQK